MFYEGTNEILLCKLDPIRDNFNVGFFIYVFNIIERIKTIIICIQMKRRNEKKKKNNNETVYA